MQKVAITLLSAALASAKELTSDYKHHKQMIERFWESSESQLTAQSLASKAKANCELSDGIWSQGSVAGEQLDFCVHNADMLRNQQLFEAGKGGKL